MCYVMRLFRFVSTVPLKLFIRTDSLFCLFGMFWTGPQPGDRGPNRASALKVSGKSGRAVNAPRMIGLDLWTTAPLLDDPVREGCSIPRPPPPCGRTATSALPGTERSPAPLLDHSVREGFRSPTADPADAPKPALCRAPNSHHLAGACWSAHLTVAQPSLPGRRLRTGPPVPPAPPPQRCWLRWAPRPGFPAAKSARTLDVVAGAPLWARFEIRRRFDSEVLGGALVSRGSEGGVETRTRGRNERAPRPRGGPCAAAASLGNPNNQNMMQSPLGCRRRRIF